MFPFQGADHVTEQVPGAGLVTGDLMDPARCRGNITAQTGLTASLYCCLGTENKDLGVGEDMEIYTKFDASLNSFGIAVEVLDCCSSSSGL